MVETLDVLKKHNAPADLSASLFMALYMRISKANGFNKRTIRESLDEAYRSYEYQFPER